MIVELLGNNKEAYYIDPGGINDQWFYGIKQLNKYKVNDYKSLKTSFKKTISQMECRLKKELLLL